MAQVYGTITIKDGKDGRREKSSAQILSNPTVDSRVYPNYCTIPYNVIRQLRKDPTVQLARWAVLAPMIHTPWMYKLRQKDKGSKEMLNFLEENLDPLRDQLLMSAVFGTLDFGWQPFEVILKPEDGYIYIDEFKCLLQDFTTILVYMNNGKFAGYVNETFGHDQDSIIREDYALRTNFDTEGTDWYGNSVFQSIIRISSSWDIVQDSANRFDKKIAGATWVIYYPVGRTKHNGIEKENDVIAGELLNRLEASGCIAVPDEIQDWTDDDVDRETKGKWRIELVTAKGTMQGGFIERQKYLDSLKMRAFGIPERSVLEGSKGTKAEADVHGDVSLSIVDSRHRLLCTHLNLGPIPRILALNFGKKYAYAACVEPAPLVDNQFKTIKEIYARIISDGDALAAEVANLDMKAIRDELGVPTGTGLKIEKKEAKPDGKLSD